jgi:hypothetical protein
VDWIHLAQDRGKGWQIPEYLSEWWLLRGLDPLSELACLLLLLNCQVTTRHSAVKSVEVCAPDVLAGVLGSQSARCAACNSGHYCLSVITFIL